MPKMQCKEIDNFPTDLHLSNNVFLDTLSRKIRHSGHIYLGRVRECRRPNKILQGYCVFRPVTTRDYPYQALLPC